MNIPFWVWFLVIVAGSCLFCWYISPNRSESPSTFQKIVAKAWIIFRRLVCFSCAALCVFVSYALWGSDGETSDRPFGALGMFTLALLSIYVGIVGQGGNYYGSGGGLNLYKEIKKKYDLKW